MYTQKVVFDEGIDMACLKVCSHGFLPGDLSCYQQKFTKRLVKISEPVNTFYELSCIMLEGDCLLSMVQYSGYQFGGFACRSLVQVK